MISFDLKSGYHLIDIHPGSQTFLGFAWKIPEDESLTYYQFTVLPFCLSTAPFVFTKCLKPVREKYWRSQGTNIALCLDDGWLSEGSYDDCMNLSIKLEQISISPSICKRTKMYLATVSRNSLARSDTSIFQTIEYLKSQKFYISDRELASFTRKIISTSS